MLDMMEFVRLLVYMLTLKNCTLEIHALQETSQQDVSMECNSNALKPFLNMICRCVNNTCESVGVNGDCSQTADCPPNQYCKMGICSKPKEIGESCSH
jgi:hypothetical protein